MKTNTVKNIEVNNYTNARQNKQKHMKQGK